MSRTPTLFIDTKNTKLGELYTAADRAYCTALEFVQERLAKEVTLEAPVGLIGGSTSSVVTVTPFSDPFPGSVKEFFSFKTAEEWPGWYKPRCFASTMVDRTEALTYWPEKTVGVNIPYHTYSTLVHESFHLLSHADFRLAFVGDPNEGCTELLTRAALGFKRGEPRRDNRNIGDIYGTQLERVSKWVNSEIPDDVNKLLAAYALGDKIQIKILQTCFKK